MGIRWSYFAIPGISFKSEPLKADPRVAAPILDVPRVSPGLKDRMQVRGSIVLVSFIVFMVVSQVLQSMQKEPSIILEMFAWVGPSAVAMWLLSRWRLYERWKAWRRLARNSNYLMCHNCGQDLRGCSVQGTHRAVQPPWEAQPFDVVACPKCESRHSVPDLLGVWDT